MGGCRPFCAILLVSGRHTGRRGEKYTKKQRFSSARACVTSSLISKLFLSVYWCALIRILLLQQSQTFDSVILVLIFFLHSDAYLRSLTLSHKMGSHKLYWISTIWRKMYWISFFLDQIISHRVVFRSSLIFTYLHTYFHTLFTISFHNSI